ncbi:metal-dependent hydrolase [Halalkaliarchaeum sp. AArc-GB]|uniref:metal-dependent hydrolase n=1 Tax=unclassified Halalkaliarchaeum TaxID=2678344 RepID=UPI00217EFC54|nr:MULTISPECIES: metal-dependent hydrolase [unclassified Halalkaliarchaeum]MDR5672406.1 metal-dependent hydrolase [Halalkaliarchaeum sp. AArc-GB]
MPNYRTHARWGRRAAVVVALSVGVGIYGTFELPILAVVAAVGAAATTFVGSIYPDVDHHNSIPRRKATRIFRGFAVFGVVSLGLLHWERLVEFAAAVPVEELLSEGVVPTEMVASGGIAMLALGSAALVDPLIGVVTRQHRDWTHSVPINFVLTVLFAAGIWLLVREFEPAYQIAAVVVVAGFFLGCLVHLGLDGELV